MLPGKLLPAGNIYTSLCIMCSLTINTAFFSNNERICIKKGGIYLQGAVLECDQNYDVSRA